MTTLTSFIAIVCLSRALCALRALHEDVGSSSFKGLKNSHCGGRKCRVIHRVNVSLPQASGNRHNSFWERKDSTRQYLRRQYLEFEVKMERKELATRIAVFRTTNLGNKRLFSFRDFYFNIMKSKYSVSDFNCNFKTFCHICIAWWMETKY